MHRVRGPGGAEKNQAVKQVTHESLDNSLARWASRASLPWARRDRDFPRLPQRLRLFAGRTAGRAVLEAIISAIEDEVDAVHAAGPGGGCRPLELEENPYLASMID